MKFNLEEKKKRKWKNGLSITPFITQKKDAGDVEKGIENFNALMNTGNPQGEVSGEGQAMGEAIEAGQVEKAREIERDIQWYEEKEDDQPYNAGQYEAEIGSLKQDLKENKMDILNESNKKYDYDDAIDYIESQGIGCDPAGDIEGDEVCGLLDDWYDGQNRYGEYYYYKSTLDNIIKEAKNYLEDSYQDYQDMIKDGEKLDDRDLAELKRISKILGKKDIRESKVEFKHLHEVMKEANQTSSLSLMRKINKKFRELDPKLWHYGTFAMNGETNYHFWEKWQFDQALDYLRSLGLKVVGDVEKGWDVNASWFGDQGWGRITIYDPKYNLTDNSEPIKEEKINPDDYDFKSASIYDKLVPEGTVLYKLFNFDDNHKFLTCDMDSVKTYLNDNIGKTISLYQNNFELKPEKFDYILGHNVAFKKTGESVITKGYYNFPDIGKRFEKINLNDINIKTIINSLEESVSKDIDNLAHFAVKAYIDVKKVADNGIYCYTTAPFRNLLKYSTESNGKNILITSRWSLDRLDKEAIKAELKQINVDVKISNMQKLQEDAFQLDKDFSVEDLIGMIKVNAPESREEEKPEAKECMINEINIPDNMRFKDWDIDAIGDDVLQLNWTTQEPFTSEDSEKFIAEIKRFFEALVRREEFHKPFTVALEVMSRSLDEDDGHLVYDIDINKEGNEEMKPVKEDLNNVTEVEDKAKEVMDPTFASAVREIRSHDEEREELKKVRKAPKEGEEVLPKDLKMNLDESLFTEWVEDVEVLNRIKSPVNDDVELSADMKLRDAYTAYEPEEFQLDRLRNDITLKEVWEKMKAGEDIYELASVDGKGFDSAVREGIFVMLEMVLGIDYDTIYDTWLHPEIKESCTKSINESEEEINSVYDYLDSIMMGNGYVTVDKIEMDIEQAPYNFTAADVINTALEHSWKMKMLPDGLSLIQPDYMNECEGE